MIMPVKPQPEVGNEKLTKRFFLGLPTDTFLVSNCFESRRRPVFAEYLLPSAEREEQWRRICAEGADQRKCHIFEDESAFQQWLDEHVPPPQK
jgi:hypothetical protein